MKENKNESAEVAVAADTADKRLGKFDTADELLRAYNALESEFTKRCQLVSELQARLSALEAQAVKQPPETAENEGARPSPDDARRETSDEIETVCTATGVPPEDGAEIYGVPSEILDHLDEYAVILAAIPQVMDACIEQYKRRLLGERGVSASPRGMAVIVPAARPKTLADAKRLAMQMISN